MGSTLRRLLLVLCAACLAGCTPRASGPEVIAYTALDAEFSAPIYKDFQRETGITVLPKFDTESTKTIGLYQEILTENNRPRCDVFWNNEILNTLRLEQRGMLEPYPLRSDENLPEMYRSSTGDWHALAARGRVLIVNTEVTKEEQKLPRSIRDLADGRWRGRAGIAKPLFGTMATHAACLFTRWGAEDAKQFFREIKDNHVHIMSGNKQVALAVGSGQLAFGLTDTDDAIAELDKAMPVAIVYPDQGAGQLGTLFIPNTVCIIKGGAHKQAARRLVDYIVSPEVEAQLALGASAQIPLNSQVDVKSRLKIPADVRQMEVDFHAAAAVWDETAKFLREEFTGP